MKASIILLTAVLALFFTACRHQPDLGPDPGNGTGGGGTGGGGTGGGGTGGGIPCDPSKVYFQQQVLPVLLSNCAMSGCHDVASHQKGVILTSYQYVMATADVRPGNPGGSDLYEVIVESDPRDRMPPPPRPPLSTQQIQLIRDWILQGAQDLSCDNLCDSTRFGYSAVIRPLLNNKCQGCHNGPSASGGIDLTTHGNVLLRVQDGKLWGAVNHMPGYSPMPKNSPKLSACELSQIRKWIDAGAPNN